MEKHALISLVHQLMIKSDITESLRLYVVQIINLFSETFY